MKTSIKKHASKVGGNGSDSQMNDAKMAIKSDAYFLGYKTHIKISHGGKY